MFSRELLSFSTKPKLFRRKPKMEYTSSAVGRISWAATSLRSYRGDAAPVLTRRLQPTFDIPENRVLRSAAKRVAQLLSNESPGARVVRDWAHWEAPASAQQEDIRKVSQILRKNDFGGSHSYYKNALKLSLIIPGASGVEAGDVWETNGILFNMPGLYEDFIRTSLMRNAEPTAFSVQKSFASNNFLLTNGEIELIPDITIYRGGSIRAVLDVKYKVPDSKDLYQVYTYMKFAQLDLAYIISPSVQTGQIVETFDAHRIIYLKLDSSAVAKVEGIASTILGSLH